MIEGKDSKGHFAKDNDVASFSRRLIIIIAN